MVSCVCYKIHVSSSYYQSPTSIPNHFPWSTLHSSKTQSFPSPEHVSLAVFTAQDCYWEDIFLPCSMSSLLIHSDSGIFVFSMQSRETLTLHGLESVQKDVKTKKLEEELEKFQIGEEEFVHLVRNDDHTIFLYETPPERQSEVCCTWIEEIQRQDILILPDNCITRQSSPGARGWM